MADISVQQSMERPASTLSTVNPVTFILILITLIAVGTVGWVGWQFSSLPLDADLVVDSTVGELSVWLADQSAEEAPEAWLGQYARGRAVSSGVEQIESDVFLTELRTGVVFACGVIILAGVIGSVGLFLQTDWTRPLLMVALLGTDMLLLIFPSLSDGNVLPFLLLSILLLLLALFFAHGKITKLIGFIVVLSSIVFIWEGMKLVADTVDYSITRPLPDWTYNTYPTLKDALAAVESGEVTVALIDRRDVRDIMAVYPPDEDEPTDPATTDYPNLRYLEGLDSQPVNFIGMEIRPQVPGRLSFIVLAENAENWHSVEDFLDEQIGTTVDGFAATDFFIEPREQVLLSLRIFNDLNLPHLQSIAEAFLQPARRNGPLLLARILADAAIYTWQEAVWGFAFGAILGFVLGTLFAHFAILSRSLLPYVVASQTVPIIAIAPMVVIWLGAGPIAVAVIAAYLTFFPMTINTLRGLLSPDPRAVELMESLAATKWQTMWKLRFPSALPYIFTALKVSATSSVVGAIIGELPSSIGDGLGRAILDLSSDYSLVSTPKLWAAIIAAAAVGIIFFLAVSLVEYWILHRYIQKA